MTITIAIVCNAVMMLGFLAAVIAVAVMPSRQGGFAPLGIRIATGGAMSIFVFVGLSHVLQFTNMSKAFDLYENYLKVMFIPIMTYAAYTLRMNEQMREVARHSHALSAEHGMLMRIVDTTPTGIAVLDGDGRVEFANERARDILGLAEDPDTGALRPGDWVCSAAGCPGSTSTLACCRGSVPVRGLTCTLQWADGRSKTLTVNSTPIASVEGASSAAVVAFNDAQPAAIAG